MHDRIYIDQAKKLLDKDYSNETIIYELKEYGIPESIIPSVIAFAKAEYHKERGEYYTKANKILYYLWLMIGISTLIFFLFVLPHAQWAVGYNRLFSFLGSFLTCLFIYMAFIYYKKWDKKFAYSVGKPKFLNPVIVLTWLPGITLYFIFSGCFSYVQENMLNDTQVQVSGLVISANSTQIKKLIGGETVADLSSIVVQFMTLDGQKMIVAKDIDADQLKNFYKGEDIQLIYSKSNPKNINILADESSLRKFKSTQERDLGMPDLLHLVTVSPANMLTELNKISYGWIYDPASTSWANDKRQCAITIRPNQLILIGKKDFNYNFPSYLTQNGFTKISIDDSTDLFHTGEKVFENNKFTVTIKEKVTQNGESDISIISVKVK